MTIFVSDGRCRGPRRHRAHAGRRRGGAARRRFRRERAHPTPISPTRTARCSRSRPRAARSAAQGATVTITVGVLAAAESRHAVRVVVLGGGRSSEHPVSLDSGRSVLDGLERGGHDVRAVVIGRDGVWRAPPTTAARRRCVARPGRARCGRRLPCAARPVRRGRDGAGPARVRGRAVRGGRRAGLGGLHGQGRLQGPDGARGHAPGPLRGRDRADWEQRREQVERRSPASGCPCSSSRRASGRAWGSRRCSSGELPPAVDAALAHDPVALVEAGATGSRWSAR